MYTEINETTIKRLSDGAFIPVDDKNSDYQDFLIWQQESSETPAVLDSQENL